MTPEFGVNPTSFLLQNSFQVYAKGGVWALGSGKQAGLAADLGMAFMDDWVVGNEKG